MPRRAVRRLDPQADLSQWLYEPEQLPRPWVDGAGVFDAARPLEVEIGSGKGLFLRRASQERPEHNFLGVEVAKKYARYCAALLARDASHNAAVLAGDGLWLLRELMPEGSLEAVHVYFPDPWWKARHAKRRVMNQTLFLQAQRTLRVGGVLHFWTDVREYYDTTIELAAALQQEGLRLTGPHAVSERPAEHHLDYRTHFERRTRLNDQPVFRCEFHRNA